MHMNTELKPVGSIRNNPGNPRSISQDKFRKLCDSMARNPKFIHLRPIILDETDTIIAGNMRYLAACHLDWTHVPCVYASDLNEEEIREFIIIDNVPYGEWDWDTMGIEYNLEELQEWGLDVPSLDITESKEAQHEEDNSFFLNIEFDNEKQCAIWFERLSQENLRVKIVT